MQIRCPHCHHPVEVIDEKLLDDVMCPSCGSNISLVSGDATIAHTPGGTAASPPAGPKRLGHFELFNQIGIGGFGAVWKARDTVLDRIVASKVPRRGQLDASEIEYFLRDARAAAQLRHPSIVSVHEVGRDGDTVFIASDYIEGDNLKEWLTARPMTVRETAEFVAQIADAVQHAHDRGVVHRDLKPGNILIDQEGRPHVADFGLAKRETGEVTMTVDGQILGTPAYMSPEQARGKAHEADAVSDVYSLGVILFELLTGELPFRGEKRMLILQILNDEPPSPRKLNGRVPRDMETICLKCLQKEPKRRFASAQALAADLRRFLRGEPITARPIRRTERMRKWIKRHPAVSIMSALLAAVTLAGLVTTTILWRSARNSLTKAEALQYVNQIAIAKLEVEREELVPVYGNPVLEECRSDLRGWEWDYLKRISSPILSLWQAHDERRSLPNDIAFTNDGQWLVTAHTERVAIIWDVLTGEVLRTFDHDLPVHSVSLSADSGRLVTTSGPDRTATIGSGDNSAVGHGLVTVWDTRTGGKIRTRDQLGGGASKVAISSDGARIVSADKDGSVVLWHVTDGTTITKFPLGGALLKDVAISPDGRQLATLNDTYQVKLVESATGQTTSEFTADMHPNYDGDCGMTYSASGRTLAVTGGIWDAKSGTRVANRSIGYYKDVAYSPLQDAFAFYETFDRSDGDFERALTFLGASDGIVRAKRTMSYYPERVAISHDGQRLALVGNRHEPILLLDGWAGHNPLLFEQFEKSQVPVGEIVPSPTDRYLLVRSVPKDRWDPRKPTDLTIISTETGRIALRLQPGGGEPYFREAMMWCPNRDALALVTSDNTIQIWDIPTREIESEFPAFGSTLRAIAWSPDAKQIAAVGGLRDVLICDVSDRKIIRRLKTESNSLKSVVWSPDGLKLAAQGEEERIVYLWSMDATKSERLTPDIDHPRGPSSPIAERDDSLLRWSEDSAHLAIGTYNSSLTDSPDDIWLIDVANPKGRLSEADRADRYYGAFAIAWQPGTCNFALSGPPQAGFQLIDAKTRAVLWQKTWMPGRYIFSPDGRRIIGGRGSMVVVYDAATGDELISLREFKQRISELAFSHSGGMLFAASVDGSIRCYNGTPLKRTPSIPFGPVELARTAEVILSGKVSSMGTSDQVNFYLTVQIESIQKDDRGEFEPNDRIIIKCRGPVLAQKGARARFYLASKSNDETSKSEVWTTVPSDKGVVLLSNATEL